MRVRAGLVTILVAAVVAGCGGSSATPTASPGASTPAASSPAAAASEQPTESSAPETPAPTAKATPKPPSGGYTVYIVRANDTLYAIAKKFSTTVAAIMALNPSIKDPGVIHVGQKIKIPKK